MSVVQFLAEPIWMCAGLNREVGGGGWAVPRFFLVLRAAAPWEGRSSERAADARARLRSVYGPVSRSAFTPGSGDFRSPDLVGPGLAEQALSVALWFVVGQD